MQVEGQGKIETLGSVLVCVCSFAISIESIIVHAGE